MHVHICACTRDVLQQVTKRHADGSAECYANGIADDAALGLAIGNADGRAIGDSVSDSDGGADAAARAPIVRAVRPIGARARELLG